MEQDDDERRINMTLTVPVSVKARVKAYAHAHNNRASRIVENAIVQMLGDWGTEADLDEEHRALVRRYFDQETRKCRS